MPADLTIGLPRGAIVLGVGTLVGLAGCSKKSDAPTAPAAAIVDAGPKDVCSGADVDLYAALHDASCVFAGAPVPPAAGTLTLTATLSPDHMRGWQRPIDVTVDLANTSSAPVPVVLDVVEPWGGGPSPTRSLAGFTARLAPASPGPPARPADIRLVASQTSPDAAGPARARIVLEPGGHARGHFSWQPMQHDSPHVEYKQVADGGYALLYDVIVEAPIADPAPSGLVAHATLTLDPR